VPRHAQTWAEMEINMEKTIKLSKAMEKLNKEINEITKISNVSKRDNYSSRGMIVWFKHNGTKNYLWKNYKLSIVLSGVEVYDKRPQTPKDCKEAIKALRLLKKKVKAFEKSCKKAA
jgi:hypothetical protein